MCNWLETFLFTAHRLTQHYPFLHEWFRQMVLVFEVPVISWLYQQQLNGSQIFVRHSLTEPGGFNIFMSDIDLTIVVRHEEQVVTALALQSQLRIFFKNLGEPEVLTEAEWRHLKELETPESKKLWEKIFQVRKLSWQAKKLQLHPGPYERAKIERGIGRSLEKTGLIQGWELKHLHQIIPAKTPQGLTLPHYCYYLECTVDDNPGENTLLAKNLLEAASFLQLLPGYASDSATDRVLKNYLTYREICSSLCQARILTSQGKDASPIYEWIEKIKA